MDKGEVCLPIHDSFIVRLQAVTLLYTTMQDVYLECFSQNPGIKPEFGYKGVSMAQPRKEIHAAKQLTLDEVFVSHMNDYSLMNEFYFSWERANFPNEEIALRCKNLNLERNYHKDLGLSAIDRHKLFGLPMLLPMFM
jgi:hypothetical protein